MYTKFPHKIVYEITSKFFEYYFLNIAQTADFACPDFKIFNLNTCLHQRRLFLAVKREPEFTIHLKCPINTNLSIFCIQFSNYVLFKLCPEIGCNIRYQH